MKNMLPNYDSDPIDTTCPILAQGYFPMVQLKQGPFLLELAENYMNMKFAAPTADLYL